MASRVIGFVQAKGGVGKTTTALNLAAELVRRGHSLTFIDADPSASATLVADGGNLGFGVEQRPVDDVGAASAWASKVRSAATDFVIIDAPGAMGAAFGATIAVAHLVIVPAGATVLDLRGAAETIGIIRRHRKASARNRPDILIVPSRIDRRTIAGRDAVATLASLTEPVSPAISYRATVADSLAAGETVPPDSPSAVEFAALADAVLVRIA